MSRRRDPGPAWPTDDGPSVLIVCSDGGQHRGVRRLGKVKILGAAAWEVEFTNETEPAGADSFRDGYSPMRVPGANPPSPQDLAETSAAIVSGRADPHITEVFRCRKCGGEWRHRREWYILRARALAERGFHNLDLSSEQL